MHCNHFVKDQCSQFIDHLWEPSTTIEDTIVGDSQMEIVTSGCLMLDDGKKNRCHFDVQDFMTKYGMWYAIFSIKLQASGMVL